MYNTSWQQPFTNKRYLHPPMAENIFTMWPEFRVICGDVVEVACRYRAAGLRLLVGEDMHSPDFKAVQYEVREDGIPVHALSQDCGTYTIRMESFCNTVRVPTCYTEFAITNTTDHTVEDAVTLLLRTGREDHLVGTEVDGYAHYDANVYNWGFIPSEWQWHAPIVTDGDYAVRLQNTDDFDITWQGDDAGLEWHQRHVLRLHFTLGAGETKRFYCGFRHGEAAPFDYETEKAATVAFWQTELARLYRIPGGEDFRPMVRSLVAQCLQMFAYPVGRDFVFPRQGGLQRIIWPNEAIEFLMALDRLGDFYAYTETAYDAFFFTLQAKEGENVGAVQNLNGQAWGSITGASVWGCSRHLLFRNDIQTFDKFKEPLYQAFCWMERQRDKTRSGQYKGAGIFPPMKSSDWPGEFQSWTLTDAVNLIGYEWLAKAFEHFGDARAAEVRAGYEDYMARMKDILHDLTEQSIVGDEMRLTFDLGVEMTDPPYGSYSTDGPGMLIRAKVIAPCSREAKLIEQYYRNRGMMKNGLTGRMNDGLLFQGHNADPWAGHTWYTSFSDIYWFENWFLGGEREKAYETLSAQWKYGMSKEYYMLERFADNDPYWTPWMPNASANGRFLMMLSDWFEQ